MLINVSLVESSEIFDFLWKKNEYWEQTDQIRIFLAGLWTHQRPGDRNICQEQNSSLSNCRGQVQSMLQICLAHLTGCHQELFGNQTRLNERWSNVMNGMCLNNCWNVELDNIGIVLTCSPVNADAMEVSGGPTAPVWSFLLGLTSVSLRQPIKHFYRRWNFDLFFLTLTTCAYMYSTHGGDMVALWFVLPPHRKKAVG